MDENKKEIKRKEKEKKIEDRVKRKEEKDKKEAGRVGKTKIKKHHREEDFRENGL